MSERALSFGSAAEQYERFRLGYPDEVADLVLAHAARAVRSALEVGAGTGKATRLFAGRGIRVTALEPDAGMAGVLARTTAGFPVEIAGIPFEAVDAGRRFDLLYAAAAWHWTDPATRWSRAVGLLAPGGVLALFGRPADPADPGLAAAVAEVEQEVLPDDEAGTPWSPEELAAVDGLTDVVRRDVASATPSTAEEYLARLGTVSAYLVLDPAARAEALRRVRAVLPDRFDLDTTVRLGLARRV